MFNGDTPFSTHSHSDFSPSSEVATTWQTDGAAHKLKPRSFHKSAYLQIHSADFHPGVNRTWQLLITDHMFSKQNTLQHIFLVLSLCIFFPFTALYAEHLYFIMKYLYLFIFCSIISVESMFILMIVTVISTAWLIMMHSKLVRNCVSHVQFICCLLMFYSY